MEKPAIQQSFERRSVAGPVVLGLLLIAAGAVALALRQAGIDFFQSIGDWGWPLFVIAPGLLLLVVSLVFPPPRGIGFAIGGAVVTTVGALLAYQSASGDWDSWAYAWALIPTAAGCALLLYGVYARRASMVRGGLWLGGSGAALFVAGAWFFTGILAGRASPAIHDSLPLVVVGLGTLLVLRAVAVDRPSRNPDKPEWLQQPEQRMQPDLPDTPG